MIKKINVIHYEDNNTKKNQNYKNSEFKKIYKEHLMNIEKFIENISSCPYHDPDAVECKDINFYKKLEEFLKLQSNRYAKELGIKLEFEFDENNMVIKENKIGLKLTSDQFGFSAPRLEYRKLYAYGNLSYPYSNYIALAPK